MNTPVLYRKRIIPAEYYALSDDIILSCNEDMIITSWKAFHTKSYLSYGYSCYYLKRGIKMSKFYRPDHTFSRWYFDIVSYECDPESNSITAVDLLADVVVMPDGAIKVVDLDELSIAIEKGLITPSQARQCLQSLDSLLRELYSHGVSRLIPPLEYEIMR